MGSFTRFKNIDLKRFLVMLISHEKSVHWFERTDKRPFWGWEGCLANAV
jgi:hypothetical protein